MAMQCVACPHPGVNFDASQVGEDEKWLFVYWFSYDGNFQNPQKAKKVDTDNISFTDGLMYYVSQKEHKDWVSLDTNKQQNSSGKRPDCDNHKAAADLFVKYVGLDVSGVGAATCTQHSTFIPRGFVDFFQGEK
ncbi:hypothetical protein CTheo_8845 [Ceratobasidium theobromae]|uniref:Uncharacterized protein n=1 Tax=Ceratobasidium theobromae TaxID=1582974 RepID=A0A5N5Q7R8_9AGAM|nr:hypothetical protein CTheo_8845 [Ceratobasidium theobromae]